MFVNAVRTAVCIEYHVKIFGAVNVGYHVRIVFNDVMPHCL
mgnify:CR=1 FL=1